MSALRLFLLSGASLFLAAMLPVLIRRWQSGGSVDVSGHIKQLAGLGIITATIWAAWNSIFVRTVFLVLSVFTILGILMPEEATFFTRNAFVMLLGIPYAIGFIVSNFQNGGINAVSSWVVLPIVVLASYKTLSNDAITGPWVGGSWAYVQTLFSKPPVNSTSHSSDTANLAPVRRETPFPSLATDYPLAFAPMPTLTTVGTTLSQLERVVICVTP